MEMIKYFYEAFSNPSNFIVSALPPEIQSFIRTVVFISIVLNIIITVIDLKNNEAEGNITRAAECQIKLKEKGLAIIFMIIGTVISCDTTVAFAYLIIKGAINLYNTGSVLNVSIDECMAFI